jgi:hypothetical protein
VFGGERVERRQGWGFGFLGCAGVQFEEGEMILALRNSITVMFPLNGIVSGVGWREIRIWKLASSGGMTFADDFFGTRHASTVHHYDWVCLIPNKQL